jgi:hypothetical protein
MADNKPIDRQLNEPPCAEQETQGMFVAIKTKLHTTVASEVEAGKWLGIRPASIKFFHQDEQL